MSRSSGGAIVWSSLLKTLLNQLKKNPWNEYSVGLCDGSAWIIHSVGMTLNKSTSGKLFYLLNFFATLPKDLNAKEIFSFTREKKKARVIHPTVNL